MIVLFGDDVVWEVSRTAFVVLVVPLIVLACLSLAQFFGMLWDWVNKPVPICDGIPRRLVKR